ncbi:MAG: ABC transporter permease [Theionarchaea archaeon]|nr:ABC transporter permease [Theionarchaea archaeon]
MMSSILSDRALKQFKKNRKGIIGLSMLAVAVFIAVFAPYLILYDPLTHFSELEYVNHPPTLKYPLGTDLMGCDIYSQIIWGFRSALAISIPASVLVGIIGTVVGLVSGYYGGLTDAILQRINITFLVWPSIPFVALIVYSWGGYQARAAIIFGVAFTLWTTTARVIRSEVLSLKNRPFIEAAKVSGASSRRIIFRHILPNTIHLTFLYMTIAVASSLILEATVNFLGMGDAGIVTWGRMLAFTLSLQRGYAPWWTIVPPGIAITYMVVSFFLISAGLRESMRITTMKY